MTFAALLDRGRATRCLQGARALGIGTPHNGFQQAVVNGQGVSSHGTKINAYFGPSLTKLLAALPLTVVPRM
jgi:hypothetical protein